MRYAIFSDIHEDIESLQKLPTIAQHANCDRLVCLGDIAGFDPVFYTHADTRSANACIEFLKKNCDIVTAGNHDYFEAQKLPNFFRRHRYPPNWHRLSNTQRIAVSKHKAWRYQGEAPTDINPQNRQWLADLPEYVIEQAENFKIVFSHHFFPDLTASADEAPKKIKNYKPHLNFMNRKQCQFSFVGHRHLEHLVYSSGKRLLGNSSGYKKMNLNKTWFVFCPALVQSSSKGFLIFDTNSAEVVFVRLDENRNNLFLTLF